MYLRDCTKEYTEERMKNKEEELSVKAPKLLQNAFEIKGESLWRELPQPISSSPHKFALIFVSKILHSGELVNLQNEIRSMNCNSKLEFSNASQW